MRKYDTRNTSASIESTPTSQSLAERTYSLIGMIASVMRPTAANQARTNDLVSLKSNNSQAVTPFKHPSPPRSLDRSDSFLIDSSP